MCTTYKCLNSSKKLVLFCYHKRIIIKNHVTSILGTDKLYKELNKLSPQKKYYEVIKDLKRRRSRKIKFWGIKDKNEILLSNKIDILNRWAEFYSELNYEDEG